MEWTMENIILTSPDAMTGTFAELSTLWSRRGKLTQTEWEHLYTLVMEALHSAPPAEENSPLLNSETRDALRQSFFVDKVLLPATGARHKLNPTLTPGAINVFYRRYLIDQIRAMKRRQETPIEDTPHAQDGYPDDNCSCQPQCSGYETDNSALEESARYFLQQAEDWVILYLALNFCHGRERLPLSQIQQQFQIPSYHYKAKELGITSPQDGFAFIANFADTRLGRWLLENDIALQQENISQIRHALDILCRESFAEFGQRQPMEQQQ